jgi:hypothetical protein
MGTKDILQIDKYLVQINDFSMIEVLKQAHCIQRVISKDFFIITASTEWLLKNSYLFKYKSLANNLWKLLSPMPNNYTLYNQKSNHIFNISVKDIKMFQKLCESYQLEVKILNIYKEIMVFRVNTSYSFLIDTLLDMDVVETVEVGTRKTYLESPISDFDNSVNSINIVHAKFPTINGNGLVVSVKENRFDSNDIDFANRVLPTNIASKIVESHATEMATIIGGAGNSFYTGKGTAWGVTLSSADFSNLMPDNDVYSKYNISIQNHSYGVQIENFYGSDAAAYDASAFSFPTLLNIFSSGNSGEQISNEGIYAGISNFANLTGSFKMAKNVLTVGAITRLGTMPTMSSKGPAYDGRIKPEVVAYSENGSSNAAAVTSGVALLLQHAYKNRHDEIPDNVLIKGILINGADDIGTPGPDFFSGYGRINAYQSLNCILTNSFKKGVLNSNQDMEFPIYIPHNVNNFKVTLIWNDPPARPGAYISIVNDLDLELLQPEGNLCWKPWVLNSSPNSEYLQMPPVQKRDSLNNVEQITITYPISGEYIMKVKSNQLSTPLQSFYIIYQWDTLNTFNWSFPSKSDFITENTTTFLRWKSCYNSEKGTLSYTSDLGQTWKCIDSVVDLKQNFYLWNTPQISSPTILKMQIGSHEYYSDTVISTTPLSLHLEFNCIDSIALSWNKDKTGGQYIVSALKDKYMDPIAITNDTFVTLYRPFSKYLYFSVCPIIKEGNTSPASLGLDIKAQRIDCYVQNFLADLIPNNRVALDITLSTTFNIQNVAFERETRGEWKTIANFRLDSTKRLQFQGVDSILQIGINNYRAKIKLNSGAVMLSNINQVYFSGSNEYVVFPNPLRKGEEVQIIARQPNNQYISIYNFNGKIVYSDLLNDTLKKIKWQALQAGIYLITIFSKEGKVWTHKIWVH